MLNPNLVPIVVMKLPSIERLQLPFHMTVSTTGWYTVPIGDHKFVHFLSLILLGGKNVLQKTDSGCAIDTDRGSTSPCGLLTKGGADSSLRVRESADRKAKDPTFTV